MDWMGELGNMRRQGGNGAGNIPYARGIMSGNTVQPPLAREVTIKEEPIGQPGQPAPAQSRAGGGGGSAAPSGPGAGMGQGGVFDPSIFLNMMESYVQALMRAASGGVGGQNGGY